MQDFKRKAQGELYWEKRALRPPEVPGNSVEEISGRIEVFVCRQCSPFAPLFESCICLRGTADRMKAENRSPISGVFRGGRGCGDGDLERFVGKT